MEIDGAVPRLVTGGGGVARCATRRHLVAIG